MPYKVIIFALPRMPQRLVACWRVIFSWPIRISLFSRISLFLLAYLSLIFIPLNSDPNIGLWRVFPNNLFLDGWARWDAGWYVNIAENGYLNQPLNSQGQKNVVFFPAYPISIRLLNLITHNSFLSGILISNIAFVVASALLYKLVCDRYNETVARWSVVFLSVYPFSFYFSAVYTESLFLLAVVSAFYFGEQGCWPLAAASAALASATRSVGITVALGMVLLYLDKVGFDVRRLRWDALWLLLCPVGILAYAGFLFYRFGDPFLFVSGRNVPGWEQGMGLSMAWQNVKECLSVSAMLAGHCPVINIIHLSVGMFAIALSVVSQRRLSIAHWGWAVIYLTTSFLMGWHGMGRYVLPAFPMFISLAKVVRREGTLLGFIILSALLLSLFTVMYTHFFWVS